GWPVQPGANSGLCGRPHLSGIGIGNGAAQSKSARFALLKGGMRAEGIMPRRLEFRPPLTNQMSVKRVRSGAGGSVRREGPMTELKEIGVLEWSLKTKKPGAMAGALSMRPRPPHRSPSVRSGARGPVFDARGSRREAKTTIHSVSTADFVGRTAVCD